MEMTKKEFKKEFTEAVETGERYLELQNQIQTKLKSTYNNIELDKFIHSIADDPEYNNLLERAEKIHDSLDLD